MALGFNWKRNLDRTNQVIPPGKELIQVKAKYRQDQWHWASFLQYHSEKLTLSYKKLILAVFCLLSGGYSLYLIVRSDTINFLQMISIGTIKITNSAQQIGSLKHSPPVILDKRVSPFRNYSDTVKSNSFA